jgi:ABC-type xylose transport system permease subunit
VALGMVLVGVVQGTVLSVGSIEACTSTGPKSLQCRDAVFVVSMTVQNAQQARA